jgi:hypothetical protein
MAFVSRPSIAEIGMAETLETLIGIQEQVIQCRRFAAEVRDAESARILNRLADDLEHQAREVDRKACSPDSWLDGWAVRKLGNPALLRSPHLWCLGHIGQIAQRGDDLRAAIRLGQEDAAGR